MKRIKHFIDGQAADPHGDRWLDNFEPATGQVASQLASGDSADIDAAVAAAKRAAASWASTPAEQRANALRKIADEIERRLDAFAAAESNDTGKPISLARSVDIPRAIQNFRFFASAVEQFSFEAHLTDGQALNYTLRRPHGVAGLIAPWNLPLYLLTWKIAPALATGNTVVAKPSELSPATAALLGEAAAATGLPAGVLNIVQGLGASVGAALVDHPDVPVLSFTGGTQTGEAIALQSAPKFKKVALELGGKNPNILFEDADFELAVETTVRSSFANQGQICLCGSRILVQRSIYDKFLSAFLPRVQALVQGDPQDPGTQQGALISAGHLAKVERYVKLAREEGGQVECGGSRPTDLPARCESGYFHQPTVVTGLSMDCRTNQEEVFGPFVTVTPFEDEQEAVALANQSSYGLAATIWTSDVKRAHRVGAAVDCGIVWVNCWLLRDLRVPFGGMKRSGVGREGGLDALRFFTESKNICVGL